MTFDLLNLCRRSPKAAAVCPVVGGGVMNLPPKGSHSAEPETLPSGSQLKPQRGFRKLLPLFVCARKCDGRLIPRSWVLAVVWAVGGQICHTCKASVLPGFPQGVQLSITLNAEEDSGLPTGDTLAFERWCYWDDSSSAYVGSMMGHPFQLVPRDDVGFYLVCSDLGMTEVDANRPLTVGSYVEGAYVDTGGVIRMVDIGIIGNDFGDSWDPVRIGTQFGVGFGTGFGFQLLFECICWVFGGTVREIGSMLDR